MPRRPILAIVTACLLAPLASAHPGGEGHDHSDKPNLAQEQRVLLGWGENAFESVPGWGKIPEAEHLGPTHGSVAVDKDGLIYVTLDNGTFGIAVYKPDGTFVKGIAPDFVGLHSLMYRVEDGVGYLYGAHLKGQRVAKLTLEGEPVWTIGLPEESGKYTNPRQFQPTSVAVGPDGDVYIADGYGTMWVHQYDKDQKYIRTFGGPGNGDGQFKTCHGIALDTRGEEPRLLVCDRENRRLQYFDLEGNFLSTSTTGLYRPCAVSFYGDLVAIAELAGRVVILNKENEIVSVLGDNPNDGFRANFNVKPTDWTEGIFNAPHGLSYDNDGNLIIEEWNKWGRVTFLKKIPADQAPKAPTLDTFSGEPEKYGNWISRDAKVRISTTSQWDSVDRHDLFVKAQEPGQVHDYAFHTAAESAPQVDLDLGAVHEVRAVSIWNRQGPQSLLDRAAGLILWVSEDGQAWKMAWRAEQAQAMWEADLEEPVKARYLRLQARPDSGETFLHLKYLRVYGE